MKHFFFLAILLNPLLHVLYTYSQTKPNDWENPGLVSQNTLPPHAWFIPYSSEQAAILHKKNAERIQSLNGRWKFHLAQNPAEIPEGFYKEGYNTSKWNSINVPGHWQTQGFDKFIFTDVEYPIPPNPPFVPANYNPVGSYKRNFTIPANWKEKRILLRFGAVNSFFYCWINGHYIGLSKDSKTPAEFDISAVIKKGINSVAVQVFRFSDGTYLEGQDMWKLSGIERNVELIARPRNGIRDYFIKAGLDSSYTDGIFNINLALNNHGQGTDYAEIRLLDDLHNLKSVFSVKLKFNGDSLFKAASIIPNVRKWNAETPNTYTVLIVHKDKFGKTKEAITQKIGFRSIEIKNGLFLVNGRAIKIKGVNRHEHDMVTGKVIEIPGMIRDIQLFKQYNINAMRCSHYPNREEWYELCLKYGIYVIDEVNLECDGMSFSPLQTLSDKPEWKTAYLDRTRRMFERDKNFSCIIGWSLGNESQWGENFIASYTYLKEQDNTRTVQYEPAEENPYTDLFVPMYKSIPVWEAYVAKHPARPLILCEYAHMMGNSGGNFKDDWDLFYKYDQLQGGFIWDFADQTFKKKDKNGRTIWAYGRDMGKVGATSDTSFCADGMFHADRSPHPQAYEMKKVYQNIHFELRDAVTKTIAVTNRFDFISLQPFLLQWQIKADGKTIVAGNLEPLEIAPHTTTLIQIRVPDFIQKPGTEYFLHLVAITRNATELVPANFPIAREQFLLPAAVHNVSAKQEQKFPELIKKENEQEIKIISATVTAAINKKTGWLNQFNVQGVPIIKEALEPHFWRAATDNDIGNSHQITAAVWQHVTETATLDSLTIDPPGADSIVIRGVHSLPSVKATYLTTYTFYKNGSIRIGIQMHTAAIAMPDLPRFGMRVILTKSFEKVSWLGRGPFDNYQDRKDAADIDLYTMPADSLFFPYARAQESGYRTDVRWMALQNKKGLGIMAIGTRPVSTGVLHFNMNKLEFDRNAAENNHGGSMTNEDLIWWNIDDLQMGVGGDNSWGAKTHTVYTLPYKNYSYEFLLKPVLNNKRLTEIAKEP